ncbi:MAG: hypothetical protein IK990_03775 [Ruminiclostridium sp.]|nr:hypothetical protein [Ruminiclostridium sp.]
MLIYLLPIPALAMIIIPLVIAIRKAHSGVKFNRRRTILLNSGMFIGTMIIMTLLMPVIAAAEGAPEAAAAAVHAGASVGDGMKYLAAALPTGLATIGTGIAVGNAASAAIGAVSEDEKTFSKALIFVALGEGVAIYGLLVSILILNG